MNALDVSSLTPQTVPTFVETTEAVWQVIRVIDADTVLVDGNPDGGYRKPPRKINAANILSVETLA